jgi:hypothetical protein
MWTFHVPEGTSKQDLVKTINASAPTYLGIPGLIRKYYGIAEDGKTLVGIYLWKSKQQADAFYTTQWVAMVTDRWRSAPTKQEWSTPMVVESEGGKLLAP